MKFKVKVLSGLHTGADTKAGTFSPVRKKKMKVAPREVESNFQTQTEQRTAFMTLLLEVYKDIDVSLKRKYMGYYAPLKGNLLAAAAQPTKWKFLDTLLTKSGIKTFKSL